MNKKESKNGAAFYIALCCCVAVIGLVGYAGRLAGTRTDEPTRNASADLVPESTPVMLTDPTAAPEKPKADAAKPKAVQTSAKAAEPTSAPKTVQKPESTPAPDFKPPCSGRIIAQMSGDALEYNKILCDWRTHDGVDIAVGENEQVKAVHSGTVTEVYSGVLGETVIVDCKNGFTAVYGCLSGTDALSVGQEIAAGYVIGTAGRTGGENVTEPHLHLELIKDGENVNPLDYISVE